MSLGATKLQIYNKALSLIRGRGQLQSLTNERDNTKERQECDLWYDHAVQIVLEAAYWPEALVALRLAGKTEGEGDWNEGEAFPGFRYIYDAPGNMLRPWFLTSFNAFMVSGSNPPDTAVDTLGLKIHTNTDDAILVYCKQMPRLDRVASAGTTIATQTFDGPSMQLINCIVYTLAALIAESITGRDNIVNRTVQQANYFLQKAQTEFAAPQGRIMVDLLPRWLQERGMSQVDDTDRYFYPYGQLLFQPEVSSR